MLGLSPKINPAARRGSMNMLSNGSFTTNTTGWTEALDTNANGTLSAIGGVGRITLTGAGAAVYSQPISTVVGRSYRVTGNMPGFTGTVTNYLCRKSDEASPTTNIVVLKSGPPGAINATFTATATTSYISIQINASTAATGDYDDIVVRPA